MDSDANKFSINGGFLKIKMKALANGRVSSALFNDPAPFPILVIDENITLAETKIVSKTVTSNEEFLDNKLSVEISPNPFSESLNLIINSTSNEDVNIQVNSIEGKQIYSRLFKMNEGVNEVSLDEALFPNQGVYFINVESQSMKTVKRVIKN
ncbi:MAG: T9SS type A sorting domain-containing protein [Saprospiraceae bacterium]|nr:T9SS type A sorting domain-containing protein [Saprospiraceae bacterium]